MEVLFHINPEHATTAWNILKEAEQFGANVDDIKLKVEHVPIRHSLLEPTLPGIMDLRWVARAGVLAANGVDKDEIGIRSQLKKIKEEAFRRGDSFSFVVWKDHFDRIVAQGEMRFMTGSNIYRELIALGATNRGWESVVCWDLGDPEFYLDENKKHFQRVHPKSQTFFFSDELEELRTKGDVVTYSHAGLYGEGFEAYLVDRNEYTWPTLYKIRATLSD